MHNKKLKTNDVTFFGLRRSIVSLIKIERILFLEYIKMLYLEEETTIFYFVNHFIKMIVQGKDHLQITIEIFWLPLKNISLEYKG